MKNYLFILLLALIPITVLAKGPSATMTGTVTKVSDGDTIKIQTVSGIETIRLIGVDTPEKFPTRYGYAECFGAEASHYVEGLLPVGTQVYIEFYGNDKYSRDLADIYINSSTGALVSREIIKNGYGWVYRRGIKSKPYASLIRYESIAKRSKIGLWSDATCSGKRKPIQEMTSSGGVISTPSSIPTQGISSGFSCSNVPKYCSGVKTRQEAQFYLNSCGASRFDRDQDGLACEDIK